jgi:L-fuconolactonase
LEKNGFGGSILVQSHQSREHNDFMLQLANENSFIKGIVGWIDLQAEDITGQLTSCQSFKKIKGFRHVLQDEADRALMLKPEFKRGIAALGIFNYTYDILIYPDQLSYALALVAAFPYQSFIIDHIAKPAIRKKEMTGWEQGIRALAKYPNVYCKISGMVNENDWEKWEQADFTPYIDVIVESFGTRRIMYGSDWPVCLLAASYEEVLGIVKNYFSSFSVAEQALFFGGNAKKIYNLN